MLEFNFTPFPVLQTARLLIRQLNKEDAPSLFLLRSDPRVLQHIGREPAKNVEEVEKFIEKINASAIANEAILWGIATQAEPGKIIGTICYWQMEPENYRAEIGYALVPGHWGKGYMGEAIRSVLHYGFDTLQLNCVVGMVNPDNIASWKALEKAGFKKDGRLRQTIFFGGKFYDSLVYSFLKNEYAASHR